MRQIVDDGGGRGVVVIVNSYCDLVATTLRIESDSANLRPCWAPSLHSCSIEGDRIETGGCNGEGDAILWAVSSEVYFVSGPPVSGVDLLLIS